MQGMIKFGFLFLILAVTVFILLYFLGLLLPIAVIFGGIFILSIIFFSVILAFLAILLAIYYAITKKPRVEESGNWNLERVKGKEEW